MARLGTNEHPAILRVANQKRAEELLARCQARGWQVIIGVEPEQPEDLTDLQRLEKREALAPPLSPAVAPRGPKPHDYCPCGSGKKFRKCCQGKAEIPQLPPYRPPARDLGGEEEHENEGSLAEVGPPYFLYDRNRLGAPDDCPRCKMPLQANHRSYLIKVEADGGEELHVVGTPDGRFCEPCRVAVLDVAYLTKMLGSVPGQRPIIRMRPVGILKLDLIPAHLREVPLDEIDPWPVILFHESSAPPAGGAGG